MNRQPSREKQKLLLPGKNNDILQRAFYVLFAFFTVKYSAFSRMKTLVIYDQPMCCSTGVCGPAVDPELVRAAAFFEKMSRLGVAVERFNLAFEPMKFVENPIVRKLIENEGSLPAVFMDGKLMMSGRLPSPDEQEAWAAMVS